MTNAAWGTTSGFRSDYELTVTESYWSPPTDKTPNWTLIWNGTDEDGEEIENACRFGAGAKWASFDGGETVDHEEGNETKNGKPRQFHQNSGMGELINTFIEQYDGDLDSLVSPRVASVWVGSVWYMEEIDASFTNRQTGEKVARTKVAPTKLISFGGASPSGSVGKAEDKSGFDPQIIAKLRDIAMSTADHATFMNAALGLPEVPTDDKLVIAVSQESFFQKLIEGEEV